MNMKWRRIILIAILAIIAISLVFGGMDFGPVGAQPQSQIPSAAESDQSSE